MSFASWEVIFLVLFAVKGYKFISCDCAVCHVSERTCLKMIAVGGQENLG